MRLLLGVRVPYCSIVCRPRDEQHHAAHSQEAVLCVLGRPDFGLRIKIAARLIGMRLELIDIIHYFVLWDVSRQQNSLLEPFQFSSWWFSRP